MSKISIINNEIIRLHKLQKGLRDDLDHFRKHEADYNDEETIAKIRSFSERFALHSWILKKIIKMEKELSEESVWK